MFFDFKNFFKILYASELDYNSAITLAKTMTVINKTRISFATKLLKNWKYFVSNWLSSTWRGIPATSKHSLLEYWEFTQHWRPKVTIRLVSSVVTCLVTASSDLRLLKLLLNLRISSKNSLLLLFFSATVLCKLSTIGIRSLLSILSNDSSVYSEIVDGWCRYKVKVRLKSLKLKISH